VRASRMRSVAAGVAIAVSTLAAAGCTGHRPTRLVSSGSAAQIRHLASAIVLESVVSRFRIPPPVNGGRFRCPRGFAFIAGPGANPALCYKRIGESVTITSAAVGPVEEASRKWGLAITVPPGDRAALAAVSTRAVGHQLAMIVAGEAWAVPYGQTPLTHGMFEIPGLTRTQAKLVQRLLDQSG
jgi:hypothetical protein